MSKCSSCGARCPRDIETPHKRIENKVVAIIVAKSLIQDGHEISENLLQTLRRIANDTYKTQLPAYSLDTAKGRCSDRGHTFFERSKT